MAAGPTKSQARLRLRQAGKHRRERRNADVDWVWRNKLARNMAHAFEMNVWPRHYADDERPDYYNQMTNYLTGEITYNQQVNVRLVVAQ